MARSKKRLIKRNNDIRSYYKALQEKNKKERKYLTEYLIDQTADKFYLESRTIYMIIAEPMEDDNQLTLFPIEEIRDQH